MVKNIFFDFDGVIVDSVNVKTKAFEKLYLKYGKNIAKKVVEHHRANGGMSRFEKFKLYHSMFLGSELSSLEVNQLAKEFSILVKEGVINSPEVNGSHKFLKKYNNKYNMFIITGTPTNESREICYSRGINYCFREVCGSPQKKDYWIKYLLKKYSLKISETIFVGDALADYDAAQSGEILFFLREYSENYNLFKNIKNIYRFNDFMEFEKLLETL